MSSAGEEEWWGAEPSPEEGWLVAKLLWIVVLEGDWTFWVDFTLKHNKWNGFGRIFNNHNSREKSFSTMKHNGDRNYFTLP